MLLPEHFNLKQQSLMSSVLIVHYMHGTYDLI
jgi:hypothetical protein